METIRTALFAAAIAALILAVLVMRSMPTPDAALLILPLTGALLAVAATRTCPSRDQIARFERTSIVGALCLWALLAARSEPVRAYAVPTGSATFEVLIAIAIIGLPIALWWIVERRLARG